MTTKQYLKIWAIFLLVMLATFLVYSTLTAVKTEKPTKKTIDEKLQELYWIENTIRQNVCNNEKLRVTWTEIANTEKTDRVQLKAILSPDGNAREIFLEENQKFDCK